MAALKKKEILAELEKLGISSHDIDLYYREYINYTAKATDNFLARTSQRIITHPLPKKILNALVNARKKTNRQVDGDA